MNGTRRPSGRPQDGEYAPYARGDIEQVAGEDIVETLARQAEEVAELLAPLDEGAANFAYAPGKWAVKQVVGHLADDERIYAYRTLCIARGESAPLPGFDENAYMAHAGFERRPLGEILEEYRIVRGATIALFRTFSPEAWLRRGTANGYSVTARGLAFHIAGHELHHLRILREKYLGGR